MKTLNHFLGSIAFSGYFPFAPATFSSLLIAVALGLWGPGPLALALLLVVTLIVSVPVASALERDFGKDPKRCTIDELAGMLVTLQCRNLSEPGTVKVLIAGFFLFRFFDILKIWPARRLEGLPAGWGIVADDLAAGLYSALVLLALFPWLS